MLLNTSGINSIVPKIDLRLFCFVATTCKKLWIFIDPLYCSSETDLVKRYRNLMFRYYDLVPWFCLQYLKKISHTQSYSEPYQTSKMEHFAKIVNGWKPFTTFAKHSILDVSQGSEYATNTLMYIFLINCFVVKTIQI